MVESDRDLSTRLYRAINVALKLLKPYQSSLNTRTTSERLASFMLPFLNDGEFDKNEEKKLFYQASYATAAGQASKPKTAFAISDLDGRIAILKDLVDALSKVSPIVC